jgi:hypothetical protein
LPAGLVFPLISRANRPGNTEPSYSRVIDKNKAIHKKKRKRKKKTKNPQSSVVVDTLGHTTYQAALSTLPTAKPTHAMLNLQVTRQEHQQNKTKQNKKSSAVVSPRHAHHQLHWALHLFSTVNPHGCS